MRVTESGRGASDIVRGAGVSGGVLGLGEGDRNLRRAAGSHEEGDRSRRGRLEPKGGSRDSLIWAPGPGEGNRSGEAIGGPWGRTAI